MQIKFDKKSWLIIGIAVLFCVLLFFLGRWVEARSKQPSSPSEEVIETNEEIKEIPHIAPTPRDSVVIKYKYVDVPVTTPITDSIVTTEPPQEVSVVVRGDSAEVSIPITQKIYETEDYRAYISGYEARMDSIFVNQKITTVKVREPTKKKWFSVGVQAGYGYTPKGFQPYVGIGVSIDLIAF